MAHIKRKYIDSHWLIFALQGAVALVFGCLMLFTSNVSSVSILPLIGIAILFLSVVEFANSLHRSHERSGWLVSTLVAIFDAAVGVTLLLITEQGMTWHLLLLGGYTIVRGVFELLIGFRTTVDPTDRFIWILCGLTGLIFGVVILNSGHLANIDFVRFFGAYLLVLGVSSLIYSVHNRMQQAEDREARREAAAKGATTKKLAKTTPVRKSTKPTTGTKKSSRR